ncbi:smad nuclear-interacting protein 1 [Pristis pectinata]|uniref:smad nuclear-interacting protein 1 n=1 Tax=Pristis pectinata TaxID=685728 RepID=UPI00223E45DB|nr:smad nuclear-interacting protein 1 [Pristis pectinata]
METKLGNGAGKRPVLPRQRSGGKPQPGRSGGTDQVSLLWHQGWRHGDGCRSGRASVSAGRARPLVSGLLFQTLTFHLHRIRCSVAGGEAAVSRPARISPWLQARPFTSGRCPGSAAPAPPAAVSPGVGRQRSRSMEAPGRRRAPHSPGPGRRRAPHSPGPRTVRVKTEGAAFKRRRSSSGSSGGSLSPPGHRRGRSPGRREPGPGPQQQQQHPRPDAKCRRERHDHPRQEHNERRHRDHSEGNEHRRKKDSDRERRREWSDRGRAHSKKNGGPRTESSASSRDREVQQLSEQQAERRLHDERRRQNRNRFKTLGAENPESEPNSSQASTGTAAQVKEEPNFELSGALVEDTNTFRGVVIKYNEPPESRIPRKRWRLYPFKNDEPLPVMHIHRQSAYLLGRQRRIVDIPIDHPSCSKQHAVLQYRLVEFTRSDGTPGRRVRPYIIDLSSANGTYLNNQRIEVQRYYELREKDVLKFGFSSREYVILHEFSDTAEVDAKQEQNDEDEEIES